MKLGLISDVHASPRPLREALQWFKQQHTDKIICAGDIAGYFDSLDETIELLQQYHCDCILGNHDQQYLAAHQGSNNHSCRFLQALPASLEYTIEGARILVTHAQPPEQTHGGIKLLDENGRMIAEHKRYWQQQLAAVDADILIVGHTHQVFAEQLGDLLVINPGSAPFNHSCMLLDLPDKTIVTHALEDREILPAWNWGMFVRNT